MELKGFLELSNYTNIYSLSTFDMKSKRGCVVSTCRSVYRVWCNKEGQVKSVRLNLDKINPDTEILGNTGICWRGFLVLALICRNRNNTFSLNVYLRLMDDATGKSENCFTQDLDFVPYKIYIVKFT